MGGGLVETKPIPRPNLHQQPIHSTNISRQLLQNSTEAQEPQHRSSYRLVFFSLLKLQVVTFELVCLLYDSGGPCAMCLPVVARENSIYVVASFPVGYQ